MGGDAAVQATDRIPELSSRDRWLLLVASIWLVCGLLLDAWAHATVPDLETFWTPWHAVLYSGIAACGVVIASQVFRLLPGRRVTLGALLGLPWALRTTAVGMALLLAGGGVDTLWHNLFGIEQDLEIFVGPSHIVIVMGMVLVALGPALMRWSDHDQDRERLSPADVVLVLASVVLASLPLQVFTLHASALVRPLLGTGLTAMPVFGRDAQSVHAYVMTTLLLLAPLLALGRRWPLPVGAGVVLVGVPAALMWVVFAELQDAWYPLALTAAAAVTEPAARGCSRLVTALAVPWRWVTLGAAAPALFWCLVLSTAALHAPAEYAWNVHATSGLIVMTGIVGGLAGLVTRRLGPLR